MEPFPFTISRDDNKQLFEHRYSALFENSLDAVMVTIPDGRILAANPAACRMFGLSETAICQLGRIGLVDTTDSQYSRLLQEREKFGRVQGELTFIRGDGTRFPGEFSSMIVREFGDKLLSFVIIRDISERKRAEEEAQKRSCNQALMTEVLKVLNRDGDFKAQIGEMLNLIRNTVKFDAVGLRLKKDGDCPYFEHNGFSVNFLKEENFLCARKGDGSISYDANGQPTLECTCGLVLTEKTDPSMPCFTAGGSFWTNVASELLELAPNEDPRINPRNRCIHDGYQSVGLFPVRADDKVIGLLQLNDRRTDRFTPEFIAMLEAMALNVGLALRRHAAADALKESERQLSAILEQLPFGVGVLDQSGQFIRSNFIMNKYVPKTMPSRDPERMQRWQANYPDGSTIPPKEWPGARALRGEIVSPGIEFTYTDDQGKASWVLVSAVPFKGTHVSPENAIVVLQDLTQRKQYEQTLAASEERFRKLFEESPIGISFLDTNLQIFLTNKRFRDFLGYDATELKLKGPKGILHPEDFARSMALRSKLRAGEIPLFHMEQRYVRKDEQVVWADVHAVAVRDREGQLLHTIGWIQDITERKKAEADLLQATRHLESMVQERTTKLSAANIELEERAKQLRRLAGELTIVEQRERKHLSKVLHDGLQQYLVAAKLQLGGIENDLCSLDSQQTLNHVCNLLNDSIQVSRSLAAELSPPILHDADLQTALQWLSRWMSEKHGLKVEMIMQSDALPLTEDIKILLFESVRELLLNVAKHAQISSAQVRLHRGGNSLQITVSDEGIGFDISRISCSSDSRVGFGLFSIKERADLIGGRLEIQSTPNNDSRFTLTVPLWIPETAPPVCNDVQRPLMQVEPSPHTTTRILLVDDHAVMREGLARLLGQEQDFEVIGQASDGQEAVDKAGSLHPDVILMDISMPRMNGVEATRIIHQQHPAIHIIGLSLYTGEERGKEMIDAGASSYLSKSGPSEELKQAIRNCMKRRDRGFR